MSDAFLIDASIYIHRAWSAMPEDLTDGDGKPVNALMGFADFLLRLLRRERPEYIMLAFDGDGCFRHRLHKDYKANRPAKDPNLIDQIKLCRELGEALGLCCLSSSEYEADDLIGTVGRHYRNEGLRCHFVSRDKDLAQLVRPGDLWWGGRGDERIGYDGIREKFGVYPEQMADYLALVGDPADCIPGIPGVGRVTAARLLARHGSAARIIESGELGEGEVGQLRRALRLTHIVCEAPLPPGVFSRCCRNGADRDRLAVLARRTGRPVATLDRWVEAAAV